MEWNKQAEEMVKAWTEVQQRIWESWLTPLRSVQGGMAGETYQKALDAWEGAVTKALDAQVDWTQRWAEGMSTGQPGSEAASSSARQAQEMMKFWTDSQKQLWSNWFGALRRLDMGKSAGEMWEQQSQQMVKAWQDAAKTAQSAMAEWTALWTQKR